MVQPGFYDDGLGRRRWWDGVRWTEHFEAPNSQRIAPAWYPQADGRLRWWDGEQWTGDSILPESASGPGLAPYFLRSSTKRLAWTYVGLGLFTLLGMLLIATGAPFEGLFCALFGGGGLAVLWSQRARNLLLSADVDGIHPNGIGTLPWADIEEIGTYKYWAGGGYLTFLGIRIARSDRYIASIPPDVVASHLRTGKALRLLGLGAIAVDASTAGNAIDLAAKSVSSAGDTVALGGARLEGYGKLLDLNRRLTGGWDLSYSNMGTEPVKVAAEKLELMRQRALA